MKHEFKTHEEKEAFVQNIFSKIAIHYDLMNTLISFNQDTYWRRKTVQAMELSAGSRFLDVACGTCMVTAEAFHQIRTLQADALDFNENMLRIGREKIERLGVADRVNFVQGDAMNLPYADNSFDAAVSAFALRNVPDIETVLREMKRVVKPGGMVVTLELAKPSMLGFKQLYNFYFDAVMPAFAKFSRGDSSYTWLPESWKQFPHQEEIRNMFDRVGLTDTSFKEMTGGVVAIHKGRV